MRSSYKVAHVLELEKAHLEAITLNSWQYRTLQAIGRCRTKEMGGHIDQSTCCSNIHISYNSCRNRHCPTCQGHKREEWIQNRRAELLPVPYFHVVFTMPSELNSIALKHPKELYSVLFKTAWETLQQFGENPKHLGATLGMIGVLHTWGQNLSLHPHLHCIVPGGGITPAGNWKRAKNKGKFLFSVKAMSKVYRAKFVADLRKQLPNLPKSLYDQLFTKDWVVFAKRPFGKPEHIIEYLGRYSHKIAISNYRILNIDPEKRTVTFSLKDYRKNGKKTVLTLTTKEFIRRFCLHILPKGFTRMRHFGFLSSGWKKEKLPELQLKMGVLLPTEIAEKQTFLRRCPFCKVGTLVTLMAFDNKGPPKNYKAVLEKRKNNIFS